MEKINLNHIKDLIAEIINKSFHTLKDVEIKVIEKKKGRYSAMVRKNWNKYFLFINKHYLKIYDEDELKRVLAHELSHIEDWVKKGILFYIVNNLKCSFSKNYLEYYEKETDKKAIRKGYGEELAKQRGKRETMKDKNFHKNKRFYLTKKEIEQEIKNVSQA